MLAKATLPMNPSTILGISGEKKIPLLVKMHHIFSKTTNLNTLGICILV